MSTMTVRLDDELHEEVKVAASRRRESMNEYVANVLRASVAAERPYSVGDFLADARRSGGTDSGVRDVLDELKRDERAALAERGEAWER